VLEHPTTLEDAMALARVYEQRLAMAGDLPVHAKSVPVSVVNKPLLLPAPPSAAASKDAASGAPVTAPHFKRLTPAEMAAKREKNECFNCPAQFSREHLKVCPMKGIFLLHMDNDNPLEETEEVDEPRVSLHAITGLAAAETMQLIVRIDDQTLGALVDSGSTHSFISAAAACRLHLEPLLGPGLHVTVANGDRVASAEICRDVHIFIDDEEFITDLFVILLGGYDMVLGVQWLRTLGPILWDFEQCHMSCWRDDHLVRW
jgi:hypothetical protein